MGVYLKPKLLLDRRVTKLWVGRYIFWAKFGQACLFAKHAGRMRRLQLSLLLRDSCLGAFQKGVNRFHMVRLRMANSLERRRLIEQLIQMWHFGWRALTAWLERTA